MSGDDGLREAVAREFRRGTGAVNRMAEDAADAVLALPEVAALRAKAAAADRVRELADRNPGSQWSKSVRRALDGEGL